jgi:hypothetical protein
LDQGWKRENQGLAGENNIMKHSYSFSLILLPLIMLLALASTLFVQRTGIRYQVSSRYAPLNILKPENVDTVNFFPDKPLETLVLFNGADNNKDSIKQVDNVLATLGSMRVKYATFDVNSESIIEISKYHILVIAFTDLGKINAQLPAIMDWVSKGGRILFSERPEPSITFAGYYRKLGIVFTNNNLSYFKGVEFVTDLFPGAKGLQIGLDFINNSSYPVQLEGSCRVHLTSADASKIPLLWEYDNGDGRVVFINSDQFGAKTSRGILGAAYSLLDDLFIYPVINASVYFIDDFPAPIPDGTNDYIKSYNMDLKNFFTSVWWPDLEAVSHKYGIVYTGVMIETYEDSVVPPFKKQLNVETDKYFGGLNLADGGEIGFHGYNHVPLCTVETGVNQTEEYPSWPNSEATQLSISELFSFGNSIFPNNKFTTYVPPSNILCPEARNLLPQVLPDLKIIASVYYKEELGKEYEQEFTEASDGIIELPRIISGYDISDFMKYASINELGLHYVNSHFVHPDDILDPQRGAQKGWANLRDQFEGYVKWLSGAAPGLRNMTSIETGMAIQRFARLAMETKNSNGKLEISLGNFYDEAWLILRSAKRPLSIDGGSITPVTSDLYLVKATKSKITISFGE